MGSHHLLGGSTGPEWKITHFVLKKMCVKNKNSLAFHPGPVQPPSGEGFLLTLTSSWPEKHLPRSSLSPHRTRISAMKRLKQKWELIRTRSHGLLWPRKKTTETKSATAEQLQPMRVIRRRFCASPSKSSLNKTSLVWRKLTRTAKLVRCRQRHVVVEALTTVTQPSLDQSETSKSQ